MSVENKEKTGVVFIVDEIVKELKEVNKEDLNNDFVKKLLEKYKLIDDNSLLNFYVDKPNERENTLGLRFVVGELDYFDISVIIYSAFCLYKKIVSLVDDIEIRAKMVEDFYKYFIGSLDELGIQMDLELADK